MADTFISGDGLILYIYDVTAVAYQPVACLTSNSLSTTRSVIETITKCDPGETIKASGTFDYSLSADGIYIDTGAGGDGTKESHDQLLEYQMAGTLVTWKMDTGLATTAPAAYYGTAILTDLSLDAPTGGENATFSVTLSGSGTILLVDPIV